MSGLEAAESFILGDTYDEAQTEMMGERVILVDENDRQIGSMSKVESHSGAGFLHRAFSVLLFNSEGKLLVQKRAASKITFPSVWANSCCSHPLDTVDEREMDGDSGVISAAIRKLEQELGINPTEISPDAFRLISRMIYKARADDIWVEHELDHILFARADVRLTLNHNEVEEVRWVDEKELGLLVNGSPQNGEVIAPWFLHIKDLFLDHWWDNLDDMDSLIDEEIHHINGKSPLGGDDLMTTLTSHSEIVNKKIFDALNISTHERLRNAMTHLLEGGGKRLRAILPRLVAEACGGARECHYDLGAAIEIIHNFTLVHDDIMDNDELRRGRPAVHIEYDLPTAINAGDAMLALAFELLSDSDNISSEHLRELVSIIGKMVRRVSEGQQMDMDFEYLENVTESEYLTMISGKTAAMFTTCARTGALLSGADDHVVDEMAEWGENLGLCFQLMDDLIDATGDSETLGKPACSDIIEGKQTLIAIHALKQDPTILTTFNSLFGSQNEDCTPEQLSLALSELHSAGSIDYAREKAMYFHRAAHSRLNLLPDSPAKEILRQLTDWQLVRMS